MAGGASPGDRIGLPARRALAARWGFWQPTPTRRSAYLLRPSPHWTRSALSHSNKHARSCAPGRRCAATAVLSLRASRSTSALILFESLGARPWAARARAELAASGVKDQRTTMASSGHDGLQELSPQELQVARIAARGQNNVEVAAALFVSRKTVEAHLTRVYRKLGIRSRTELARILLTNGIAD